MPDYERLAGATDVSVNVFIFDPATGLPDNTVVFNTAGLNIDYRRESAANVDLTLVTLATLTTAHTDNGFLLIGNGLYRLDLPDAACAAGVSGVQVHGTLTDRAIIGCYIHLVANDPFVAINDFNPATETVTLSSASETQIDTIETRVTTALPPSGPGAPSGLPLYDDLVLGEKVTVAASPTSGGDYTLTATIHTDDGDYDGRWLMFLDGPNAGFAQRITTFTGATRRCQHTGTGDDRDAPFDATPQAGNSALLIGIP